MMRTTSKISAAVWLGGLVLAAVTVSTSPAPAQEHRMRMDSMAVVEVRLPEGQNTVRLPLTTLSDHIILPISINGSEPLPMVLDTGMPAPGVVLFAGDHLKDLDLEYGPGEARVGGAGGKGEHFSARMASGKITLGEAEIDDARIIVLPEIPHFALEHAGIIGAAVFRNFSVGVDYDADEVVLTVPDSFEPPAGATEVPLDIKNNLPYLQAQVTTPAGKDESINLVLDMGATHAVSLNASSKAIDVPAAAIATHIGRGLSGALSGQVARVSDFTLGGHHLQQVVATFPDAEFENPRGVDSRDGNLGMGVMSHFNFTLDYAGGKLYLQPNKGFAESFEWDMTGLTLEPDEDNRLKVAEIVPDSPAAAAGMQAGDVVLSLDGEPVFPADRLRMREMFRQEGVEISVEYQRGEETEAARLQLRRLI